jgi:2,5-diketo-D-gluconate reductase A
VIPKSSRPERMVENLHIWDFQLTSEEIAQISAKTLGRSTIINHRDPQLVRTLLGWKVHE